jgi:hypothetical protein
MMHSNFFLKCFFCFWNQNKAKIYLIKHWMWCERIYLIALNDEWKILFYFVGFGLGAVKTITASSWQLKKLHHLCCNIWNFDFPFAIINFFYILIFVINYTNVNKYFKKFYFFWVKIKLRVLTFIVNSEIKL